MGRAVTLLAIVASKSPMTFGSDGPLVEVFSMWNALGFGDHPVQGRPALGRNYHIPCGLRLIASARRRRWRVA